MDALELANRYFAAWNRRDAGAVLETMAPLAGPAGTCTCGQELQALA